MDGVDGVLMSSRMQDDFAAEGRRNVASKTELFAMLLELGYRAEIFEMLGRYPENGLLTVCLSPPTHQIIMFALYTDS